MTDTQWPRYEVFQQETPDRPHRHAGSVHAPDAEIALLNGRDVFVRRPECSSLWVAPASAISRATAEELAGGALATDSVAGEAADFLVFAKLDARGMLSHLGQVRAASKAQALQEAARACEPQTPFVLWVVPAAQLTRSEPDQAEPLFAPALDKPYRDQAFYHIQTALRRLRQEAGG
jgi:ring-1,2-phenylacetyl-CoA epoxidase subunit PaaB